jgi:hypothetical protein
MGHWGGRDRLDGLSGTGPGRTPSASYGSPRLGRVPHWVGCVRGDCAGDWGWGGAAHGAAVHPVDPDLDPAVGLLLGGLACVLGSPSSLCPVARVPLVRVVWLVLAPVVVRPCVARAAWLYLARAVSVRRCGVAFLAVAWVLRLVWRVWRGCGVSRLLGPPLGRPAVRRRLYSLSFWSVSQLHSVGGSSHSSGQSSGRCSSAGFCMKALTHTADASIGCLARCDITSSFRFLSRK